MQNISEIDELIKLISKLPGLGPKSAKRIVLKLINNRVELIKPMANALAQVYKNITRCNSCGSLKSNITGCSNCENIKEKFNKICVVEDMRDVLAIENTQQYNGLYHVLGGVISPMDGIGPSHLFVESLIEKSASEEVKEIIFALSTTLEGDTTNFYLYRKLGSQDVNISTLSRGISIGDELHYADELTLGRSILNRTPFENSIRKQT